MRMSLQDKQDPGAQPDANAEQLNQVDGQGLTIMPATQGLKIATYKSFPRLLLRVLNLCFSSFYFGYTLAYLGSFDFASIVKLYDIQYDLDTTQGLLQGITSIGAGAGALSASVILKVFSRKNAILFVNSVAFVCGLLVLVANLKLFFAARFMQGACIGLYSAMIPLLIKEYSPKQICGTFGALNQTFIAFGVFFAFAFQLIMVQLSPELEHWRIIYGFTLITICVQTVLLIVVYKEETPKYLLLTKQEQKCIEYLQEIYKPEYVKIVLNQKKEDLGLNKEVNLQANESSNEPDCYKMGSEQDPGKRIRVIFAIHLAVLQQFVGINCVVSYGVDIVAKIVPSIAKVIPVILNFEAVLASLVSSFLLARVGRKTIMQAGTLVATISLLMVAVGFLIKDNHSSIGNALIILGLIVFMADFGLSLGPLVWLYIAQIVEPQFIPFTTLANWSSGSLVVILFPILSSVFGGPVPLFFFFAAWAFMGLFVNKKFMVETKGRSEKEIRQLYAAD